MLKLLYLSLLSNLLTIDPTFGSIFCKDSQIDAISYVEDNEMWFFVSEGHYWYISNKGFPPSDADAKKLEEPFKRPSAAVYIDSIKGCPNLRSQGVKPQEKHIWIAELIDGKIMLISLDIRDFKWGPKGGIDRDSDHCIGRSKIEFNQQIDAMFTTNFLSIYVVQNLKYSMVDCSYLCTDPNDFGEGKGPNDITDFDTKEPIDAMLKHQAKMLYMFQKNNYYEVKIQSEKNGKLKGKKNGPAQDIMKLFKVNMSEECTKTLTTITTTQQSIPEDTETHTESEENFPESIATNPGLQDLTESNATDSPTDSVKTVAWVVFIVLICCLAAICFLYCFCSIKRKAKTSTDGEAAHTTGAPPKTFEAKDVPKADGTSAKTSQAKPNTTSAKK